MPCEPSCWGPCPRCGASVSTIPGDPNILRVDLEESNVRYHQIVSVDDGEWDSSLQLLDRGACPCCDGWEDGTGYAVAPQHNGI